MRVISQDKTVDVPYEASAFEMKKTFAGGAYKVNVYANVYGKSYFIGEYDTEEKAISFLETMRDAAASGL